MEKLITKKNLFILNIVLAVVLLLPVFNLVRAIAGGSDDQNMGDDNYIPKEADNLATSQPKREVYDKITDNDLFKSKQKIQVKEAPATTYWPVEKDWELQALLEYSDGLHALIMDKGRRDPIDPKLLLVHDVKVGDIVECDEGKRKYEVEILEITKEYVKCYRLDMENSTEDERTFTIELW